MDEPKELKVRMARADDDDLEAVREFLDYMAEQAEGFVPDPFGLVQRWNEAEPGFNRVVEGYQVLRDSLCDPTLSYLDVNEEVRQVNAAAQKWEQYQQWQATRPRIVCLCGPTRFKQAFITANFAETMKGNIVLTVGWFGHADGHVYTLTPQEKIALDELHKRKIDLADEVLAINVGGYVGESTVSEIAYAAVHGKPIRWLEPDKGIDIIPYIPTQ